MDVIQQQISINGQTLIIFNNRKPDAYAYADVYDPDNPETGKYFPTLYSVVIKEDGTLWYVYDRDESTYKSYLTPCNIIETAEDDVKIVSYGNDRFCVYQDQRTDPYKLVIDAKLLFFGNNLTEYTLSRTNELGDNEIISIYIDSSETFRSNRVPMTSISASSPAYKFPTNCHTTHNLTEGEPLLLSVYNNLGNLAAEVTIFVRNAIWLNDLSSTVNPIVELNAECTQMTGDDFFIYEKQDPSHLNIRPYLLYADGSKRYVNIDNTQCFLYGFDEFIPSYPGHHQTLMIKYFLSYKENALDIEPSEEKRFLTVTKNLIVLGNKEEVSVKVTTIPVYDQANYVWKLRFFAYSDYRDAMYDITDITVVNGEFDGSNAKWGHEQNLEIEYDMQSIFTTDETIKSVQTVSITLWNPTEYVRYTIRDNSSDYVIYGVDGSVTRRPIIHRDTDSMQYFIPTSVFGNWEAVIESFYYLARPPYNSTIETEAPVPTHFNIRDAYNGQQLIGGAIGSAEYGQIWPTIVGTSDLVGQTVIVEFLQEVAGTYQLLYGVPVDVVLSETGYNSENNP